MKVSIINPSEPGSPQEGWRCPMFERRVAALKGWARRKGLSELEAEDFVNYYQNPKGWYGDPERYRKAVFENYVNNKGYSVSSDDMEYAVENAWFGEKVGHRITALKKWAKRRGLAPDDAMEFANFVENSFYGDPEMHRRDALMGWKARTESEEAEENPLWTPILPEPYQTYLGVAEMKPNLPTVGGGVLGFFDTALYSGIGEFATRNDWGGTVIGLGGGLATSEVIRRYWPGDAELRDGIARGQRIGTYTVSIIRVITSIIKSMAGTKKSSGMLGEGLEDIMEKVKEGKIFDAFKIPVVKGLGYDEALGEAFEMKFPEIKLPAFLKMSQDEDEEEEEYPALSQDEDETIAISAQDEDAEGIALS